MSRYDATITVETTDKNITSAIHDSIVTDELFYPENPVSTKITITAEKKITITAESDNIAHLRANLNSTLRLVQACHASILESMHTA